MAKVLNCEGGSYAVYCPGCESYHHYDKRWWFNGDPDYPTFSPSFVAFQSEPEKRCHSFLTEGVFQFLNDCAHKFAGQNIPVEEEIP